MLKALVQVGTAALPSVREPHVAVLFHRIGPYHFARLAAAAAGMRVTAVEISDVDPTYAWDLIEGQKGFERSMLFSSVPVESQSASKILETVSKALDVLRPAAVAIPGWNDRCSLAALKWCVLHDVPAIVMSETTGWDDDRKTWKEFIKKRVVRLFSAGLVGGKSHADYLAQLGMAKDRIFLGYDAVENQYFANKVAEVENHHAENRTQLGLPKRYFLASARFVEKKNLARLLQAYARYRALAAEMEGKNLSVDPWDLVLLGDGPLRSSIQTQITALKLDNHVQLRGFKQYHELPIYYALADVFVHPSTIEQWGLVVNEAMASGLPILVSNKCGCASDLVEDGRNGFTFDPRDVEALARLMIQLSALSAEQLDQMGNASREIIESWGPERFAKGLSSAVNAARSAQTPRAGLFDHLLLKALLLRRTG